MPTPFLSSEEYDERSHQLYNEGQYDEALGVLNEGLRLYPNSVELHVGVGYVRLAREEFAWARQAFEKALVLDPEHEDALAGLGEVLLWLGQRQNALRTFHRTLELGYSDDIDLMLQVGRALFRASMIQEALEYFEAASAEASELSEAAACLGYAHHRLGNDDAARAHLERALHLDDEHTEARIYLANFLYDHGEYERALRELERTTPEDHWEEIGIWRLVELKKSLEGLDENDADVKVWEARLAELGGEPDDIDDMLAEIEERAEEEAPVAEQHGQLEAFGALLGDLADRRSDVAHVHRIRLSDEREFAGSWDEIVRQMRDANRAFSGRTVQDFMATEARRGYSLTGVKISTRDPESFIRGSADAGLLRIVR